MSMNKEFKNLEKFAKQMKEDREAFSKANINIQKVMQEICDDVCTYAKATIKNDRIVVEAENGGTELYHKIMKSVSNSLERPSFAFFLFNVVVRGNTISVIKKNNESDELE